MGYRRERSCVPVAVGLGSWTAVSLSNWLDHAAKLSVSFSALVSHGIADFVATGAPVQSAGEASEYGFHLFSFWSSEYVWIPHQTLVEDQPLIKKLRPHATEIFHIKPATPARPQYIGSNLHFSCGFEVERFEWSERHVSVRLKNTHKKTGFVVLYLPERHELDAAVVAVNDEPGSFEIVARPSIGGIQGRVIRVHTEIEGSGIKSDGLVSIRW